MPVQSMRIELERPDGLFYAGEVVRGTVHLQAPSVSCRGVHLRFQGKSRVHWHVGSGENRNDYDGITIFQDQRQTLYGNYYKTGVLDEAGEDADFDRIHNSGIINIPCDVADEHSLKLIVRVNDYDWGKRDDLLGEILLDVPSLVQSGAKKSFPLTRFGRPETGEVTLSARWLPFDAVFPSKSRSGANVSASVSKPLCLALRIHQATGLRKADWIGKNDVYVQVYKSDGDVKPNKALPKPTKRIVLPKETLTIPFAFQLRHDAPGSAEFPVGDRAYVRYSLRAYIDFANWRDPSTKLVIRVIPNRPLPTRALLAPHTVETDGPIYDCACCGMKCCQLNGLVSTKLSLGRLAYAPGEVVDLAGFVMNDTNKDLPLRVVLSNYVVLSTTHGRHYQERDDFYLISTMVKAGETLKLEDINQVRIPTVFPSFFGGVLGTITRSYYPCLKWSYTIEVRVGGEKGSCGMSAVHSRVSVLICSAAPYANVVEEARSRSQITGLTDAFSIFRHAIVGPDGCDTAPTVTGPEDGGTAVIAEHVGYVSTYEHGEDNYNLGGTDNLVYQPVVNTFAASPEPPIVYAHEPTKSETEIVVAGEHHLDQLLLSMEDSYDKRLTVGEWVRDHPMQAQRLSPDDVGRILEKVTFTLDQPAVVGELVAAFEATGKLTCAHIVAALKVCKYQKAEVAKLMAPHVGDPENRRAVLDQIEYTFERDNVAAAFRA